MAIYGLIGKSLSHSFSKEYFSKKFDKESIDAVYQNFEIELSKQIIQLVQDNNELTGLNVTIPFKEKLIPLLDLLDTDAKNIQAVNTIKIDRIPTLILTGYNTDHIGFRQSLLPLLKDKSAIKALILGSGGASKAIKYALKKLRIDFRVVSRNPQINEIYYSDLDKGIISSHKLIINTTPVGMHPDTETYPGIPYQYLTPGHICYDLIYNPQKTKFLEKAEKQGCTTKNGYEMLVLQAEESWKIWNKH